MLFSSYKEKLNQRVILRHIVHFIFTALLSFFAISASSAKVSALDEITELGVLKVCMWPDYFGISYRNPKTGWFQGVDIDLSQALAKDLNAKVEYVETDFSRVVSDVESGKCHIAMMGVGITPARFERVSFSDPYLKSDVYAVTTKVNRSIQRWTDLDQPGRVIAVQKGTFMEPLMLSLIKQGSVIVTTKPSEREREVESGRADAFITDYPYSQRMLINTDWARVIGPDQPVQVTYYAYAIPKGDEKWLARVNQFVRDIKMDGRLEIAAKPHNLLPMVVKD